MDTQARTSVESLLRRDRWLIGGALVAASALCWGWIIPMAREMDRMLCGDTSWMMANNWSPGHLAALFAMWAIMMVGMMLPSAAPALLLYACVIRRSPAGDRTAAHVHAFAGGYLLVWTVFSLGATLLQRMFADFLLLSPLMESESRVFSAVLLLVAGIYQLTPFKRMCLNTCRSPAEFLTRHWKRGITGGFYLGVANGLFCLGCCWALMLLLFVGGVMNLWWIAALTVFVLVEKVAPFGVQGGRLSGSLIFALGVWSAWRAVAYPINS